MRRMFVTTGLLVGLLAAVLPAMSCGTGGGGNNANCTPGPLPPSVGAPTAGEMAEAMMVFTMVNTHRGTVPVPALTWNGTAAQVAYDHCADMQMRGFFAHTNPSCQSPSDRSTLAGIGWSTHGENIAQGHPDPATVMAAWLASPGHRANIENPAFTMMGVGKREGAGGPWWTQVFFAP